MLDSSWYEGREQTYIKHFVLEKYLQRLAYKIGNWRNAINYVDCFAGPWQQASEELEDTSPFIAIGELKNVRKSLRERNKNLDIRCLFIEKTPAAFRRLEQQLNKVRDVEARALNGEFEEHIETILRFSRSAEASFNFFFIDPTGWTGYSLDVIAPLLRSQPGEVLINFMTQHVSRFIDSDDAESIQSFNRLFGLSDYQKHWANLSGQDREEAIVRAYCRRVEEAGEFAYVTHAIVLDPYSDRTHFHLIYATRHIEGLRVFRETEKRAWREQTSTRFKAQARKKEEETGQTSLFGEPIGMSYSDYLEKRYHDQATRELRDFLVEKGDTEFDELEAQALLHPLMDRKELLDWLRTHKDRGTLRFEGLGPRERTLKAGKRHRVIFNEATRWGDP